MHVISNSEKAHVRVVFVITACSTTLPIYWCKHRSIIVCNHHHPMIYIPFRFCTHASECICLYATYMHHCLSCLNCMRMWKILTFTLSDDVCVCVQNVRGQHTFEQGIKSANAIHRVCVCVCVGSKQSSVFNIVKTTTFQQVVDLYRCITVFVWESLCMFAKGYNLNFLVQFWHTHTHTCRKWVKSNFNITCQNTRLNY